MSTAPETLGPALRRVALYTATLLLVPLVAMGLSPEVRWGPGDFAVAALLLFTAGSLVALLRRRAPPGWPRRAAVAGVLLLLALIWAELAVGLWH